MRRLTTIAFSSRVFLVDKDGRISFDHTGEGAYKETELTIQELLHEIDPTNNFPAPLGPMRDVDRPGAVCYPITPELYLGHTRGCLGNAGNDLSNGIPLLAIPERRDEGRIYASGAWANQSEYLRHTRHTDQPEDFISLRYRATEVNVVMKPEDIYWLRVFVNQDGAWLSKEIAGEDIKYDDRGAATSRRRARVCTILSVASGTAHTIFNSSSKAVACRYIHLALALAECPKM